MRTFFGVVILCPILAAGQKLVSPSDVPAVEALLNPPGGLKPLKCFAVSRSARVDDGFRIVDTFSAMIPLDQYPQGAAPKWTSIVRVVPEKDPDKDPDKDPGKKVYLTDAFTEDSENVNEEDYVAGPGGDGGIKGWVLRYRGHFWTGAGNFTVYWMVLDDEGRSCATEWHSNASKAAGGLKLSLPEDAVTEASVRGLVQGAGEPPSPAGASRITVLLDVVPPRPGTPSFLALFPRSEDNLRLLAELSDLVRRIPAASVRLICFSLDRQSVVYRDEDFHGQSLESWQHLNDAISKVNFDTVEYEALNPRTHVALLAQLMNTEIGASPPPAAVIFMGRQERFHDKFPPDLVQTSASPMRFFSLESGIFQDDDVSRAIKAVKGTRLPSSPAGDFNRALERIKKAIAHNGH